MDPEEKKRLANEKRLKAVQEWQRKRNQQNVFRSSTQESFGLAVKEPKKGKLKLFGSDDEEENCDDIFNVRPQFEGRKGQHLLEMSAQFSSRFKLDERFKEDEPSQVSVANENEEKAKNIKILESILGYEVGEKHPDRISLLKKRQIKRFDPSDEKSLKFLKTNEDLEEKQRTKKRTKEEKVEIKDEEIPVSSERYIEVSTNLKDILSSASNQFTLTQNFNFSKQDDDDEIIKGDPSKGKEVDIYSIERGRKSDVNDIVPQEQKDVFESKNLYTFFICKDDERLKEGVGFFMRPKPMEEIRDDWNRRKDQILEQFRKKKRSSQRIYTHKRTTQKNHGKKTFIKQ